jgi:hypothetical protein
MGPLVGAADIAIERLGRGEHEHKWEEQLGL